MKQNNLAKILSAGLNGLGVFSPKAAAGIAGYFFSKPKRIQIKKWMHEFLDTSEKEELKIGHSTFQNYHWEGTRGYVLFAHGWKSNAARWKKYVQILQKENIGVIALDAPAHGNTKSKYFNPYIYADCIQELNKKYKPQVIVGHSAGGYACIYHNAKFQPSDISYVFMAPTYSMRHPIQAMYDFLRLKESIQLSFENTFEKTFKSKIDDLTAIKLVQKHSPKGLLIHDKNDDILPVEESRKLTQYLKDMKYIETDLTGHRMQNQFTINTIIDFIKSEV